MVSGESVSTGLVSGGGGGGDGRLGEVYWCGFKGDVVTVVGREVR